MNQIIKIEPAIDAFSVTWTIHLRCNYDCMYCPDKRHEYNTGKMLSLEEMQDYWTQVYEKTRHLNKPYKITISGGEPTINKNLVPMLQWLQTTYRKKIANIGLASNGSASLNFYLKLFEYFDWIAFSTHTEFLDEEKFFYSAIECNKFAKSNKGKTFMIKIMGEPWAKNSIQRFIDTCNNNAIHYDLCNNIDMNYRSRNYPIFHVKEYD
jgi:organic radical activating enzyme